MDLHCTNNAFHLLVSSLLFSGLSVSYFFALQADRATNFVNAAVRFCNSLMDDKLNPEIYHMNPERTDTDWFKTYCKYV